MKCVYCDTPSATAVCQQCVGELMYKSCYFCGATGQTQSIIGRDFCPECYKIAETMAGMMIDNYKMLVKLNI